MLNMNKKENTKYSKVYLWATEKMLIVDFSSYIYLYRDTRHMCEFSRSHSVKTSTSIDWTYLEISKSTFIKGETKEDDRNEEEVLVQIRL